LSRKPVDEVWVKPDDTLVRGLAFAKSGDTVLGIKATPTQVCGIAEPIAGRIGK
jgi:hypothetical protein